MRVGFTGTRGGMTSEQRQAFYRLICEIPELDAFHHGACIGADEEAAVMVAEIRENSDMDARGHVIVTHPCTPRGMVSEKAIAVSDETREPKPPLDRNKDIVNDIDILVACPSGLEVHRFGTWSTIRYARRSKKPIVIVWPDGSVTKENRPSLA